MVRIVPEQNLTAALTETLDLSARAESVVRILEETVDPGSAEEQLARQRARGFVKVRECQGGMTHFEVLLDDERATTALDQTVSTLLRARQYDGVELAAADVKNIKQLHAQRGVAFTPQVRCTAPLNETEDAGLARTPHDIMVPRTVMTPRGNSAADPLEYDADRQPIRLDVRILEQNSAARLAGPDQRIPLAWRDNSRAHPGCSPPVTGVLRAHRANSCLTRGPTIMRNLILLCAEHRQLTHHPRL